MINKSKKSVFSFNPFMDENIRSVIDIEGAKGLGIIMILCDTLRHCFNSVGTYEDLTASAHIAHSYKSTLWKWIQKYDNIFLCDKKNKIFSYKGFRRMFKLPDSFLDSEIEIIKKHGNRIKKIPKDSLDKFRGEMISFEAENKSRSKVLQSKNATSFNYKSNINDFQNSQPSDNKDVNPSAIIIDNNNNNNNNNITYNNNSNININNSSSYASKPSFGDDESTFKFFEEKILAEKSWRNATSNSLSIDLNNDDVARILAKWVCYNCISKDKMKEMKNAHCILSYATHLLEPHHKTRKSFDSFLKKEQKHLEYECDYEEEKEEKEEKSSGGYDVWDGDHRMAYGGQILPDDAPAQMSPDDRWSYIQHKYVSLDEYQSNLRAELECFNEMKRKKEVLEACHNYVPEDGRTNENIDNIKLVGSIIKNEIIPELNKNEEENNRHEEN